MEMSVIRRARWPRSHWPLEGLDSLVQFFLNTGGFGVVSTIPMHPPGSPLLATAASKPAIQQARFEHECVLFFEGASQVFGVPRSVAQIYGLLYASKAPLSFSDIVERLGASKGSVSQGLQFLRSLGAIKIAGGASNTSSPSRHPEGVDVSRREYYEPELRLRSLMSGILRERVAPLTAAGTDQLARLREFAADAGDGSDFYLYRVKQLETWRRRLRTILPVLSALLGPKK
jgi:hypothetical protein